jgi:hypothetical protein
MAPKWAASLGSIVVVLLMADPVAAYVNLLALNAGTRKEPPSCLAS